MDLLNDLLLEVSKKKPRIEWLGTQKCRIESHQGLKSFSPHIIEITSSLGRLMVLGKEMTISVLTPENMVIGGCVYSIFYEDLQKTNQDIGDKYIDKQKINLKDYRN